MFDGAKEAIRQLRDPAGGPLRDQIKHARPALPDLQTLRWGFFGHSVGADLVFPLSLEFMKTWGDVAGVASVNPTGNLAVVKLASEDCILYPGARHSSYWRRMCLSTEAMLYQSTKVLL